MYFSLGRNFDGCFRKISVRFQVPLTELLLTLLCKDTSIERFVYRTFSIAPRNLSMYFDHTNSPVREILITFTYVNNLKQSIWSTEHKTQIVLNIGHAPLMARNRSVPKQQVLGIKPADSYDKHLLNYHHSTGI